MRDWTDVEFEEADSAFSTRVPEEKEVPAVPEYSACARRALANASQFAATSEDLSMTCEDLLMALAADQENGAAKVLQSVGLDSELIQRRIRFILGRPPARNDATDASISPRLERVLEAAGLEAGRRKGTRVETLHLLVALVRERHGVAVLALESPGLGLEPIGGAIMRAFREGVVDPA